MRCNVDRLKIIQVGITLSDEDLCLLQLVRHDATDGQKNVPVDYRCNTSNEHEGGGHSTR